MTIRLGRPDDLDAVLALWADARSPHAVTEDTPERVAGLLERDALLVAEAGGEIVGICTVYLDIESVRFGRRAWVEDLAVHPDHRSEGIGARLLEGAKAWARERGASHLKLDSALARTQAHRFYEREGMAALSYSFVCEL